MTALGGIASNAALVQADVTATLDGWSDLNLASGVSAVSTGTYGVPGYYVDPFGFVHFRGVVSKNAAATATIAEAGSVPLPSYVTTAGTAQSIFKSHRLAAPIALHRVDVGNAGGVYILVGSAADNNVGVSLAHVCYRTALPTTRALGTLDSSLTLSSEFDFVHDTWHPPVSYLNSWHAYGFGYQEAGYTKTQDGTVHLCGLVQGGAVNTVIFSMPNAYAPNYRRYIPAINSDNRGRIYVDVAGTGSLTGAPNQDPNTCSVVAADPFDAAAGSAWIALDGLSYIP